MPPKAAAAKSATAIYRGLIVNDALVKAHDDSLQGLVDTGQLDQVKADARKIGPHLTTWQYAGTLERVQLRDAAIKANGLAGFTYYAIPVSAMTSVVTTLGSDKTGIIKISGTPKSLNEAAMLLKAQLEKPAQAKLTEYVVFTINDWAYSLNKGEIDRLNGSDIIDYLGDAKGSAGGRYYVATKDKARELQGRIGSTNIQTHKVNARNPDGSPMPVTNWGEAKGAGRQQYRDMTAPPAQKKPTAQSGTRSTQTPARPAPARNLPWWHHARRNGSVKRARP